MNDNSPHKELQSESTKASNEAKGTFLFYKLLAFLLLTLFFSTPREGLVLPSWYRFFIDKLCIAIPITFALWGFYGGLYWEQKRKERTTTQKHRATSLLFRGVALYLVLGLVGYFYAQQQLSGGRFLSSTLPSLPLVILYPRLHPIGFLWMISGVTFILVLFFLVQKLSFYTPTKSATEHPLCSNKAKNTPPLRLSIALFLLLGIAIAFRLFIGKDIAPDLDPFGIISALQNSCFFMAGMLVFQWRKSLSRRKYRLGVLLLFHVVLFTRIFAPIPPFLAPLMNTLYSLFLFAVYSLLAQRGAKMALNKPWFPIAKYMELIFIGDWFLATTLWPLYEKIPPSPLAESFAILGIAFVSLLLPSILLVQATKHLPATNTSPNKM